MTDNSKKWGIRTAWWLFGAMLSLCVAAAIIAPGWLDRRLKTALENALPGFDISLQSAHCSILQRRISVGHLKISPAGAGSPLLEVDSLELTGIAIWPLIRNKILHAKNLLLTGGAFSAAARDSAVFMKHYPLNKMINGIAVENVRVSGIACEISLARKANLRSTPTVSITDLKIDSLGGFSVADLGVSVPLLTWTTAFYQYRLREISAGCNTQKGYVHAAIVQSNPRYDKVNFGRRLGHQTDRLEAEIRGVRIDRIDMVKLFKHRLVIDSMSAESAAVNAYRDRRLPRLKEDQPMPAEMIRRIPYDIRIAYFEVRHAAVTYEEQPKDNGASGALKLNDGYLRIRHFVSRPDRGAHDSVTVFARASLMGSGNLRATLVIPIQRNDYHLSGAFQNVDLTTLNSASENLGHIHIKSGLLDSLGFDFRFNSRLAAGKVVGIYHKLIIEPLRKHTDERRVAKLQSMVLRRVIIPLSKGREVPERRRTGTIRYSRDPTRKFSFYMLQSLITGIKASFTLGFLLPK